MKKILILFALFITSCSLRAQNNVITYTASAKLEEVTEDSSPGLHTNAFVNIVSHTFADGTGIITFEGEVTSIGNYAFSKCNGLTSVTIPESVTSIRQHAFSFTGLTSITIPSCVKTIEYYAFGNCNSLAYVTIPNSVTSISNEAFKSCTNLASIIVEGGNTKYDSRNNCNAIIQTATNTLVLGCKNTIIPSSVTSIGACAFHNCYGLTSITFPEGITSIGNFAFYDCENLTSINIPDSVTSIGNQAFYNCSSLTSITIPNSVTSIGEYAFVLCTNLTSIIVESGNTIYDSRNNCNALIETATNTLIIGCKNTEIPNSVTDIEDNAFNNCLDLTSITIPEGITSIGKSAFNYCKSLVSVKIPNSVTSIGDYAFYSCSELNSIIIGNNVASIGQEAIAWCKTLTHIVSLAENPPILGTNCFRQVNIRIPLYVPESSIPLYQAAEQWNEFDIQPILVEIDPITPNTTEMTWVPVDSASLYQLHIYTDSTSSVALDTTLQIIQPSTSVARRVKKIIQDAGGTIIVITIDPTSGTSEENPYKVTVSTVSGERIDVHYDMTVFQGPEVIREESGSFVLNEDVHEAIENVYIPSFPTGIYDLYGHRYPAEAWEILPAGVYVVREEDRVEKVMKK